MDQIDHSPFRDDGPAFDRGLCTLEAWTSRSDELAQGHALGIDLAIGNCRYSASGQCDSRILASVEHPAGPNSYSASFRDAFQSGSRFPRGPGGGAVLGLGRSLEPEASTRLVRHFIAVWCGTWIPIFKSGFGSNPLKSSNNSQSNFPARMSGFDHFLTLAGVNERQYRVHGDFDFAPIRHAGNGSQRFRVHRIKDKG